MDPSWYLPILLKKDDESRRLEAELLSAFQRALNVPLGAADPPALTAGIPDECMHTLQHERDRTALRFRARVFPEIVFRDLCKTACNDSHMHVHAHARERAKNLKCNSRPQPILPRAPAETPTTQTLLGVFE